MSDPLFWGARRVRASCALVFVIAAAMPLSAAELRVENRVFSGAAAKPVAVSTTYLTADKAYDVMREPAEIVIFERPSGRLTLFDPQRAVRTELKAEEVAQFCVQIRETARNAKDDLIEFMAEPHFTPRANDAPDTVSLDSPVMTYRVIGDAAAGVDAAADYRDFADWLARINTMLTPGARPPFARLALNEAVAARGMIPREVELSFTVRRKGKNSIVAMHSEHDLARGLTAEDRQRLAEIERQMAAAKAITFDEYRRRPGK